MTIVNQGFDLQFCLFLAVSKTILLFSLTSADAGIVPDSSLGAESSRIRIGDNSANVNTVLIENGAVRGSSVFHSFLEFDVASNQRVFFAPLSNIDNIFSRVTGSSASSIDGVLGVLGNSNLFLLNPQGIVFGPNASLDLSGSFLATTADGFDWGNGLTFSAVNPGRAPSLLNVGIQPGLQYGSGNPGSLVSEAELETQGALEFASRTLDLTGSITTEASDVTLRGGDVTLTDMELFTRLGEGQVGKAGDVRIEGNAINLRDSSSISTESFGQGNSGNVTLSGRDIQILDGSTITTRLNENAEGRAGDVQIDANRLEMRRGSQIQAETLGQGNAGNVTLNVPGEIIMTDNSEIDVRNAGLAFQSWFVFKRGTGDSGRIVVNGGNMTLINSPQYKVRSSSLRRRRDVFSVRSK